MASAQLLQNSGTAATRKDHLEAGRRRLEEFRKKKAAEKSKKPASTNQHNLADVVLHEKQPSEFEHVRLTDSDGAGTSDGIGGAVIEPSSVVINNDVNATELVHTTELGSSYDTHAALFPVNSYNVSSADPAQTHVKDEVFRGYDALGSSGPVNFKNSSQEKGNNDNFGIYAGAAQGLTDGYATAQIMAFHPASVQDIDSNSNQYSYYGLGEAFANNSDSRLKDFTLVNSGTSNVSCEGSGAILQQDKSSYAGLLAGGMTSSSYEDTSFGVGKNLDGVLEYINPLIPDMEERKFGSSVGHLTSANSLSSWSSESRSMGFSFDTISSPNYIPLSPAVAGTNTRRSRPSFLDSINISRVSSAALPLAEPEKADSLSSKVHPMEALSASQNSMNSLVTAGNGVDLFRHGVNEPNTKRKHDFYSPKQDEDFAALEQHIEDLTQEKFSLQRALEASRALAESLATENSALTDSYNQQGSVVNQLKSDMEKLQEEIKAQLQVELESVKIEYANAQLECNAADERAKLLASEVIGLEEKALRLRSTELKLGRQLENSQAEISSFKKKISSLEKDRMDLQLTIDALQEEKKLLQSKLRKASASGKLVDVSKSPANRKDMSTSTEDLDDRDDADSAPDTSNLAVDHTGLLIRSDASSFPLQPEDRLLSLQCLSLNIPPDQMRMIQNINSLISELALEKEELMQTLLAESSQSSKLKELNKELSQKLEIQTQRLELLTAQSMANDTIPARQLNSRTVNDNHAYADEGDEVVERVLGWIMKLFPGGPSRRRTSKLI